MGKNWFEQVDSDEEQEKHVPVDAFPNPVFPSLDGLNCYRRHRVFDDNTSVDTMVYTNSEDASEHDDMTSIQKVFHHATEYLQPSPSFRRIINLYAERKMAVFFMIHFVATMIVWFHFFMIKFEQQKAAVPLAAPSYWWKRIVPPIEFGSMHAILLQMALLPLTMCRYSIATLADTAISRFVPLNRTLRMHIHLGYTMVIIVFLATLFFFLFFGLLCSRDEQAFCEKFKSEIMCTGYGILASLLIVAGTSYFRHRIPYEIFYAVHHLVFILYIITVAHTLDIMQRRNHQQRSQTFKWFSATLLFYICDRVALHINHRYRARLISTSSVVASDGTRLMHLRLQRPTLFQFRPGQYAYLRHPAIDVHWHPFSIASDPHDPRCLEFYLEVFGDESWTGKLWQLLQLDRESSIEIMGPVGAGLSNTSEYSHALAIGTGTGIVPLLSLFKQHVNQLSRLTPATHLQNLHQCRERVHAIELAQDDRKGSFANIVASALGLQTQNASYYPIAESRSGVAREVLRQTICERSANDKRPTRRNRRDMRRAADWTTRSIYGVVALSILPVFGVTLIGWSISFNTVPAKVFLGLIEALQAATVIFQSCFAAVSFFLWNSYSIWAYIDLVFVVLAPFVSWYWFQLYERTGRLGAPDVTMYCLYISYLTFRTWSMTVKPRHRAWKLAATQCGLSTLECLELIWVCRSASLVAEIIPDINDIWKELVRTWDEENLRSVCRISVHVTDSDVSARESLKRELRGTHLYQAGCIRFGRPDLAKIMQNHTTQLISSNRTSSHTLLAYVGSEALARHVHQLKISNDMLTAITGHKRHQMEFVAESYGGTRKKKTTKPMPAIIKGGVMPEEENDDDDTESASRLTTRLHRTFSI